MKRIQLVLLGVISVTQVFAQQTANIGELKQYDRSSITTLMVYHPEDEFCCEIATVFDSMPVPDKFNEHHAGKRFIDFNTFYGLKANNETYAYRSQDKNQLGINQALYKALIENEEILLSTNYEELLLKNYCKQLKIDYVQGVTNWKDVQAKLNTLKQNKQQKIKDKVSNAVPQGLNKAKYGKILSAKDIEINAKAIENLLNENNYGMLLVARWFGLEGDSVQDATFNCNLIKDRGQYNADDIDIAIAQQTTRDVNDILADAGEELIQNTYIIVNDITYVTTEEKAEAGKIAATVILSVLGGLSGQSQYINNSIQAVNKIADSFTGFDVRTHSYLYRLVWNEEVAGKFYSMYYTATPDPEKIIAFLTDTTTFKVQYVAHEYEADKKSVTKQGVDRNEYVKYICTRSLDKNIASLQLAYEDFKVKTPVFDVFADEKGNKVYTAKIGLKEGISEKSTFEVVKKVINPETNRTRYVHVATLKPIKDKVWDNRYYMTGDAPKQEINATHFKKTAGGEILPGMLIIEGKYKKAKAE
ncbi:MAG: hypothetical protein NC038_05810 [Paludibacter sp.]|nr:hypothetical protein [Bacteroidales bacterium]MCM1069265.1 hypothetical protein [Prevotella sp.]MCM1353752.1 hypothetical protein [Bacteroides sp.]MCM1442180.1 hypothetical protein [Muribaculum sp.]MCM1482142.1 hypothetical protein [Paludibacter sp.]